MVVLAVLVVIWVESLSVGRRELCVETRSWDRSRFFVACISLFSNPRILSSSYRFSRVRHQIVLFTASA
jgi:hypothetical protein